MSNCPGTDALTTIASALDWDVDNGVRHLSSCADCARQLHALQLAHDAYDMREAVTAQDVDRIVGVLANEAAAERARGRRGRTLGDAIEAMLAGGTAVTVLSASGAQTPLAAALITFVMVATAVFGYRATTAVNAPGERRP